MGYQPKQKCVFASDKEDADRIRNEIKEEYNFYIRVRRVLMKNNSNSKISLDINEIIQNLMYQYDHISISPSIR